MPRFDFHVGAERLAHDDPRFVWEANFGGEVDLADNGHAFFTFETNYQVLLGEEFKNFDPNQGNYILAGAAGYRLPGVTVAGTFYHQSRHLADRSNRTVVDWNMFGARLVAGGDAGKVRIDSQTDLRGTVRKFFVDYKWELDSRLRFSHSISPRVALVGATNLRVLGVDGTRDRGTQIGARTEGTVRFIGTGNAALELFAAVERRVDPFPIETFTTRWAAVGFRFVTR